MAYPFSNTCLKSTNSLRTQLLLSFGSISFVSLAVVVILACTAAFYAGRTVKDQSEVLMRGQVTDNLLTSSRLVSENLDAYMVELEGTVQLVVEAVKDRIVGYPHAGWEGDRFVPFLDTDTQTKKYPLNHPPPPMEWNITPNVNVANATEHSQERDPWLEFFPAVSTASAVWFQQGACDPTENDPTARTYYPNCTEANNYFETGGVVQPTPTNNFLHQKSGDISIFLKALWETQHDALTTGVYFFNSGSGSELVYPGYYWPGNEQPAYTSLGCDWMKNVNPHTGEPYGTAEEIARCHPKGTLVPQREYNPVERPWFQEMVNKTDTLVWHGPYRSFVHGAIIMTVGKTIFDRRSGEFIGCVRIDISLHDLGSRMESSLLQEHLGHSELLLVRYDDGALVSDPFRSRVHLGNESLTVDDIGSIDTEAFTTLQGTVNFDKYWTSGEAEKAFRKIIESNIGLVTAYPIPVIPKEHDPSYRPKFLVIHSISDHVFEVIDSISYSIDQDVWRICALITGLAAFGMILVLTIVWGVSRKLTQPLLWMKEVSWLIVNHTTGSRSGVGLRTAAEEEPPTIRCTPKTEINELVSEFQTMIKGFSGEGASKVASSALHQIQNELTWHSDFQQLYSRRRCKSFRSTSAGSDVTDDESNALSPVRGILQMPLNSKAQTGTDVDEESTSLIVPAPIKRNRGNIIRDPANTSSGWDDFSDPIKIWRSPLFWWIVILIVIPLLILICLICSIVSSHVGTHIPSWVQSANDASHELAREEILLTATSKASLMTAVVFEAVRNLHLMTRVGGWLYFGGVKRSTAFTEVITASEKCKVYPKGTCPFYDDPNLTPCSCEWGDLLTETCTNYNSTQSRNLQRQFWSLQSQDADPNTGQRVHSVSFPEVGSSPITTQWWPNSSSLPGSGQGEQAGGYATSYDRLRVGSAMDVAKFPVYNYAKSLGWTNRILGVFMGFEDDGLFMGFKGCRYTHADYPYWNSTEDNGAAIVAPLLCPIGKYGYDPRCRDWYASGRDYYKSSSSPFHITAPYQFAVDQAIATSATSPIANPNTGEYIGQMLLDFLPEGIQLGLERLGPSVVPILITKGKDATGGDTVVGPNKSSDWESASILDLLFEYDDAGSINRDQFEQTSLLPMKNGSSGLNDFYRTRDDGSSEHLIIAFAPVYERVLLPVSPDDFSRGVNVSKVLLYSVGIVRDANAMHLPFREIEDDMMSQLDRIQIVYVLGTIIVAVLFTASTCIVTVYIVTPMITLLRAVQNINQRVEDNEFPPLQGGSREVHRVYNTFAKLYKVVRISNTAFFSGNLRWAYHFVNDALKLFHKVNDQKAVGIASNNLGNTLFAVYYDAFEDICLTESVEDSLIPLALRHYAEAIDLAQQDFDDTPESELKADYALQLADRLFNRGLFYLLIDGEELAPADARQRAFADIRHAQNLDYDVKDYMMERKLLLKNSGSYFNRLLRRINGLADFYDDIGLQEVWDVKELIDYADQLLFAAWKQPSAPLFEEVNRAGRLQQLEAAAILLWLRMGNQIEAGRLAMRMFAEDEYLLESSFARAADALLQVMQGDNEGMSFSKKSVSCTREDFRRMVKSCKYVSLDIGKCLVYAVELSSRWSGDPILEKINANCLALYDRHCSSNDYMGVVAYSTKETLSVEIGTKEGNEGRQRTLLDLASSSTTEQATPAFPLAIQMVIDSEASFDNDSFLVVILDGNAWDTEECSSFRTQIARRNRERNTSIHLFIIGLDVQSVGAKEQCKQLCTVSKLSMYADATIDTIDGIFDLITTAIAGRPLNNGLLKGVTMERF